jgi:hypothetical protein
MDNIKPFPIKQLKPGQPIPIDINNATRRAGECGCKFFQPVVMLYTVSALVSPTGQELMVQQAALLCMDCKKVVE